MPQTDRLLNELKSALRAAGLTYADLASHLGLSEASVKRLFSTRKVSLDRLERACAFVGLELSDLVERMNANVERVSQLTPSQETELLASPKLLLMIYLLLNGWPVDEIVATFRIDDREAFRLLRQLERLGMIELLPFDHVKLLTARNFAWRRNGPVQRFFREQVQTDFFDSRFIEPQADLRFVAARLSPTSMQRVHQEFARVVREFDDLARNDATLPPEELDACAAVMAIRPWEFSVFRSLRRSSPA